MTTLTGIIFIALVCFLSFMTLTWVIEAQGAANAVLYFERQNEVSLMIGFGLDLKTINLLFIYDDDDYFLSLGPSPKSKGSSMTHLSYPISL